MPLQAPAQPDGLSAGLLRLKTHAITFFFVAAALAFGSWLLVVSWDVLSARRAAADREQTSADQARAAGEIGDGADIPRGAKPATSQAEAGSGMETVLLATEDAEARAAPSLGAVPVLKVSKGERLRVADQLGQWYRIGDSPAGVEAWINAEWIRTGVVPAGPPVREKVIAAMEPELDAFVRQNRYLTDDWSWEHVASTDSIVLTFVASKRGVRTRLERYVGSYCDKIEDIGQRAARGLLVEPVFMKGGVPTLVS